MSRAMIMVSLVVAVMCMLVSVSLPVVAVRVRVPVRMRASTLMELSGSHSATAPDPTAVRMCQEKCQAAFRYCKTSCNSIRFTGQGNPQGACLKSCDGEVDRCQNLCASPNAAPVDNRPAQCKSACRLDFNTGTPACNTCYAACDVKYPPPALTSVPALQAKVKELESVMATLKASCGRPAKGAVRAPLKKALMELFAGPVNVPALQKRVKDLEKLIAGLKVKCGSAATSPAAAKPAAPAAAAPKEVRGNAKENAWCTSNKECMAGLFCKQYMGKGVQLYCLR